MTNNWEKGTSLIEALLYIAIFSVIMMSVVVLGWNIIQSSIKVTTQQEVYSTARFISEKISYEIRNSAGINTASSNFGVNLAVTPGAQLSLASSSAPSNPTIFDVSGNYLRIKRGASAAVNLNSSATKVTSLVFTNYTSTDLTSQNVSFTITVANSYTGARQEYKATVTMEGSAEFRGNTL